MTAREYAGLVSDLRTLGISWNLDLALPLPLRHTQALTLALGYSCNMTMPASEWWSLRDRLSAARDWVKALGKRWDAYQLQ